MNEEEKIKEYLQKELAPLNDDHFTEVIVETHLANLRRKKLVVPANNFTVTATAVTLLLSVLSIILSIGKSDALEISGVKIQTNQLFLLSLIGIIIVFYLYLIDRIASLIRNS